MGALASIALAAAPGAGNAIAQGFTNRANRKFAIKMADKERNWAIDDFHMTNAYNTPSAQKQRLKDAGLNPSLIYGGSGSVESSTLVRPTQAARSQAQSPDLSSLSNLSNVLPQLANIKKQEAETENIKASNQLIGLQTSNQAIKNAYDQNSLDQARKLNDSVLLKANLDNEAAAQGIQQVAQTMTLNLVEQNNRTLKNAQDIKESMQRILQSKQAVLTQQQQNAMLPLQREHIQNQINQIQENVKNLNNTGKLQQFEITMKSLGLEKNDPIYWRFFAQMLDGKPLTTNQRTRMLENSKNFQLPKTLYLDDN